MRIYQIKNQTPSQMMGYVMITEGKKVIVVDGGTRGDAPYLRELLAKYGSHVDLWFLTHPHTDHHGAFTVISEDPAGISVGAVLISSLPDSFAEGEPHFRPDLLEINAAMKTTPFPKKELAVHDRYTVDNVTVDVLGISNPEILPNAFNNSSCVFRVTETFANGSTFKIMILGDLGIEASDKLLGMYKPEELKADMVQMAHHGQNGATKQLYETIAAKYALWPTPDWLWTNTINPAEPGKGPWKTLEVRSWMEELGARPVNCIEETTVIDIDQNGVRIQGH